MCASRLKLELTVDLPNVDLSKLTLQVIRASVETGLGSAYILNEYLLSLGATGNPSVSKVSYVRD